MSRDLTFKSSSKITSIDGNIDTLEAKFSSTSIKLGSNAGQNNQRNNAISIGTNAGQSFQSSEAVAIGNNAGLGVQGGEAVAIGNYAGCTAQSGYCVAIGSSAGFQNQGSSSIAIGQNAGKTNQPVNSIVLNASSFETSGDNVDGQNSIILNAGATGFTAYSSGLFINPINPTTSQNGVLVYDPTSYGIEYNQNFYNAFQNVYYVSPSGNDISNNGSQLTPFQTIQHAINTIHGLTPFDGKHRVIFVMAGQYTENLIINSKMSIIGVASSPYSSNTGCYLNGNVRVYITANVGDMFNNNLVLSNMLINGEIEDESLVEAVLTLENLYIYTPNDASGRGLNYNPSSSNNRLRMLNCQVISGGSSGTDPLVELTNKGQINMLNCYLSAKGIQNCLKFSGNATCDTISNVKFECGNTGANVKPLVEMENTTSGTFTFSNCGFIYNSSTNKSSNAEASGICNKGLTGTNNNIICLYSSFFLGGTNTSNFAIQDLNNGTPTTAIILHYNNNASLTNTSNIRGTNGVNKFTLTSLS
jgi:hypothetical protein